MPPPYDAPDLVSLLRTVAAAYPDADAFVSGEGERLSFGAWDRAADGVAAALADLGVGVGDVVCLFLPSSPAYMVVYQAAARLGAVTSGVNTRLGHDEVAHILRTAAPRVTVVDGDRTLPATAGRVIGWDELAAAQSRAAPALPALHRRLPLVLCWTGGTTGYPKGAVFDHDNLRAVAGATGVLSAPFDRRLSPIPFPHVGTMTRAWDEISRVITTVITPVRWTAPDALRVLERERVTVAQGVPTQWELMLRDPTLAATDLSALRLAGIGGARVPPDLLVRMRAALGVPVVNRYASTESGGVIAGTRPGDPDRVVVQTVGRASDGVELRIADPDEQGVGRVQVRSGAVMRGYWNDPVATAAAIDEDGWLTVGDLGTIDADGNLTIVGRVGEMYCRGGYNVYPAEVERVLAGHPGVQEVAVVGVPDPVLGEIGVAFVVAAPSAAPDAAELRAWVRDHLADYKAPDRVVVTAALPLTAVGKVDRRALAARTPG